MSALRVGIGWDVHRTEPGRRTFLGGVLVAEDLGPVAHSDGDVLAHALIDALLGAAGLGDVGTLFPDDDPRWAGSGGTELLRRTRRALEDAGWEPLQLDAVLICDRPKIAPRRDEIREGVARALGLAAADVGLKGKTTEGLGELRDGAGIACHAVALVRPRGDGAS